MPLQWKEGIESPNRAGGAGEDGAASFYRPVDWSAFWTAFAVSFGVYLYTLAPTLTLEDSGELCTASAYLGVPHPPGYPIWTIITWIFTKLLAWVTYLGQPNPAYAVNLVSAVFGALATGFTAILICRSGTDMLRGMKKTTEVIGTRTENLISWVGGVSSSLVFAFSSVNWSQAVIAEVYSLNAFFLVLVFFLTYTWMRAPREKLTWVTALVAGLGLVAYITMGGLVVRHLFAFWDFFQVGVHYVLALILEVLLIAGVVYAWRKHPESRLLYLAALAFGMGLTNYQVLLLIIVSLVIVVFLKDLELFRDFMILGAPLLLVAVLSERGFINGRIAAALGEQAPKGYELGYLLSIVYAIAAGVGSVLIPGGRTGNLRLVKQLLLLSIPYAVIFFLSAKGCLVKPSIDLAIEPVLPRLTHPTAPVAYVYTALAVGAAAAGYFLLPKGKAVAPTFVALALGLAVYMFMPLASETNPPMNWGYPRTFEGFLHAISRGQYEKISPTRDINVFKGQVLDYLGDLRGTFTLPMVILGFLPFAAWRVSLRGRHFRAMYIAAPLAAVAVAVVLLEEAIAPALGEIAPLTALYKTLIAAIMALAAAGGIILIWNEVVDFFVRLLNLNLPENESGGRLIPAAMDIDSDSRKWTLVTLSGFMVMSLVLIMLASPKGDIQDLFIQRVKFISSHALYAFWIGYGLIFGLSFVDMLFRGNAAIVWLGLLIGAVIPPAIPLHENAYNKELVRTYGGAEQNGHDFGWQFGNFQLRGADAITEELDEEEEPLPNPFFPLEMEPEAVFFGGTDPGRFVPTYMIYCADVRPDAYLITQNALADNTYMNVMRDLYGNDIWIPAQSDSTRAFQIYVEEVNSGKRPRNADLKIENGRVQVSGVLGVMEINGILARMIFDYNNYRHAFYVEESYVIQWMYPYLTPHGLIMKINKDPTPLDPVTVRNDHDFWDWYTRRLVGDGKFTRDVVARKSFSKLRSAIGGLYTSRGMAADAERAFQQARVLYPLSPEANFRLVQEVYMPFRRHEEAQDVMEDFYRQDPGNDKVPGFIAQLKHFAGLNTQIKELEAKASDGRMDIETAFQLAQLYRDAQLMGQFLGVLDGVLRTEGLPVQYLLRAADLYASVNRHGEMNRALDLFLQRLPSNAPADMILQPARYYGMTSQMDKMETVLQRYLGMAPQDWRAWLDLASVQLSRNKQAEATQSLRQAARVGGSEALVTINRDPRFNVIRNQAALPGRDLSGLPGMLPRR